MNCNLLNIIILAS